MFSSRKSTGDVYSCCVVRLSGERLSAALEGLSHRECAMGLEHSEMRRVSRHAAPAEVVLAVLPALQVAATGHGKSELGSARPVCCQIPRRGSGGRRKVASELTRTLTAFCTLSGADAEKLYRAGA